MGFLYRLNLRDKTFLLTLGICLVVWLPLAFLMKSLLPLEMSPKLFIFLGAQAAVFLLLAMKLADYLSAPAVALRDMADKISQGNLNFDIDFGKKVRCWELKGCGQRDCPAYEKEHVLCWFVDGTPCKGCVPRFPNKLVQCRLCEVYGAHKGDEIVQLADSFKHMVFQLRKSHGELQASHKLRGGIISHSFDGIVAADVRGGILVFNPVASGLSKHPPEKVVGRMRLGDLFPSQVAQELQRWIETRPAGETVFSFDRETELMTRDGEMVPVRITVCLLEGDGHPFGIVCFIKDEREIERLKDHLRESERMAVIGEIASALSHSIRNILQGVKGGAHVVAVGQTQESWALVAKGQEMMERNVRRMEEFMEELLRAVEQRQLEVSACEIHQLLEEAVALVHHKEASPPLLWEKRWHRFPLWVKVDPDAVRHCFFNILSNAVDACSAVTERSGRIRVETFLRGDCGVRVVFQDNGVGMDEQTSARLFGEIFTTKGSSGLGLGLFVTGRLFQRCGATTQVQSTPGEGTRIIVDFPRVLEEPCEAEASLS